MDSARCADEWPADPSAIAIVGMGCRFPGDSNSPDSFWKLLTSTRDAITELPQPRWREYSATPESSAALARTTKLGGFVADIDGFDAAFFGISPREAALMDPQQRMALEVSWEALEHAGMDPTSLAGTDAGVFMGVNSDDHGRRLLEDLPRIEAWTGIGSSLCGIPNRVSHAFDLHGPSIAVDTACSASLVSLHLACQSLRLGETSVALAGGVMLMAGPALTMVMDAAGALASDGRSKAFDAEADGYGRGEGCGIVVLRRLADARREGARVLAIIRGSGVRQDGRTNGIMAPSQEAQAELIRLACGQAGVPPLSVDYVEAHGTGTQAGDPVEAGALAAVYGAGRLAAQPCLIGSVKTNIGHLEAASGIAGVIKVVLALQYGKIPPSLNLRTPNPAIPWDRAGLRVVTEPVSWQRNGHPRRAGVSGYGYGGTIAHLLLEEAPVLPEDAPVLLEDAPADGVAPGSREVVRSTSAAGVRPRVYPISGATEAAVRAQAARLADWLSERGHRIPLASVAYTLARRRAHLTRRAAVVATDRDELAARLRSLAAGEPVPGVTDGVPLIAPGGQGAGRPGPVWVFSGHGSHWAGMGRELLGSEPVFGAVLDDLAPVFRAELGLDPRQALRDGELRDTDQIQPMTFAMQVALAEVWRHAGLRPAAVIGHSVGEFAAAVTAGALSLADAATLICHRSRLLGRIAGQGAMFMVNLPFEDAAARLSGRGDVVAAIAASPASTVVSGARAATEAVAARWASDGLRVRRVDTDVAFHSPLVEPLLDELVRAARDVTPRQARVPGYTTVLTDPREAPWHDGSYWALNLRNPVRFTQAVRAAADDGYRVFLEVSAHPVVTYSISEVLDDAGIDDTAIACTMRRGQPERATLLENLALMYCAGVPVDWARAQPDGELADLPAMAWQHHAYRAESAPRGASAGHGHDPRSNSLLGEMTTVHGPSPARVWRTQLDVPSRPYPGRHPVRDVEIVPAAVLLTTFFGAATGAAAESARGSDGSMPAVSLTDVQLRVPVAISDPREVQVVCADGIVRLNSRLLGEAAGWQTHTTAVLAADDADAIRDLAGDLAGLRERCTRRLDPGHVIDALADVGVAAMGFPWQVLELARGDNEMLAVVRTGPDREPATWAPVLDAVLSAAAVAFGDLPRLRMPARIRKVTISGIPPREVQVGIQVRDDATVDVAIATPDGQIVGRFHELTYGEPEGGLTGPARPQQLVHEITWRPADLSPGGEPGLVVLVGDDKETSELARDMTQAGLRCLAVRHPLELDEPRPRPGGRETAVVVVAGPGAAGPGAAVPGAAGPGAAGPGACLRAASLLLQTAQVLSQWPAGSRPALWCMTRGVREAVTEAALTQSPVWGLGRVLGAEYPDLWRAVIDMPDLTPAPSGGPGQAGGAGQAGGPGQAGGAGRAGTARELSQVLRCRPADAVLAIRQGSVLAARLVPLAADADRTPGSAGSSLCRPDGTYLITGGLGALGLQVAQWLATCGARRLVLAGREPLPGRGEWDALTGPAADRIAVIRELEAAGVTVLPLALDITDRVQAARLLDPAELRMPPIRGVVHAAGVLDNRLAAQVDEESLSRVMQPKVAGALVLHELFPPGSLDFLVLFSSVGPLLALPGQASYAAANGFLDALAQHRRASGHHDTISFSWTSWRGLGMSTSSAVIDAELSARGTAAITAAEAFQSWDYTRRHDVAHVAVFRAAAMPAGAERPPLLREIASAEDVTVAADPLAPAANDATWAGLTRAELREKLTSEVQLEVAAEMHMPAVDLDISRPLAEMGLDSVLTQMVRLRLARRFGVHLPVTLLWERPTVSAVAELLAELMPQAPDVTEQTCDENELRELTAPLVAG